MHQKPAVDIFLRQATPDGVRPRRRTGGFRCSQALDGGQVLGSFECLLFLGVVFFSPSKISKKTARLAARATFGRERLLLVRCL